MFCQHEDAAGLERFGAFGQRQSCRDAEQGRQIGGIAGQGSGNRQRPVMFAAPRHQRMAMALLADQAPTRFVAPDAAKMGRDAY